MKSMLGPLLALFICSAALPAFASPAAGEAYTIFGGVGGGYTHIVPDAGTSKNGYHLLLSGFAEVQGDEGLIWEAGGGLFYNKVYSGGERDFAGSQSGTVREQRNLRIETRAGTATVAVRQPVHWGLDLEAGLILRSLFGSSLSFSQDRVSRSAKFFLGPQLVYRLSDRGAYHQRFDLSLGVSLNGKAQRVYLAAAGFAVGRSFERSVEPSAPRAAESQPQRFEEVLADKIINFATASSEVQGAALGFLSELGAYLKEHDSEWSRIEVEGHTDKRGKRSYNIRLSQARADSVRETLLAGGAAPSKVTARGFGPDRPLAAGDSPDLLAANRRVVMIFNVPSRDQRSRLAQQIRDLRKKYFNE